MNLKTQFTEFGPTRYRTLTRGGCSLLVVRRRRRPCQRRGLRQDPCTFPSRSPRTSGFMWEDFREQLKREHRSVRIDSPWAVGMQFWATVSRGGYLAQWVLLHLNGPKAGLSHKPIYTLFTCCLLGGVPSGDIASIWRVGVP